MRSRSSTAVGLSLTSANCLQLVEGNRLAGSRLLETKLGSFVSARDSVEYTDDAARVWIGVLDRHREQRTGEGSLLDMSALRQLGEAGCMLGGVVDVQATGRSTHDFELTARIDTYRAQVWLSSFVTGSAYTRSSCLRSSPPT